MSGFSKRVSLPGSNMGIKTSGYSGSSSGVSFSKKMNELQMIYQGTDNRIERYSIYNGMEQDTSISWAMDVIADYVSQNSIGEPFFIDYKCDDLSDTQTEIIQNVFLEWMEINEWKKRIFNTVRDVIKYGDCMFVRDPDSDILYKVNIEDVVCCITDNNKNPLYYLIRNVDLNLPLKNISIAQDDSATEAIMNTYGSSLPSTPVNATQPSHNLYNYSNQNNILPVSAEYIVHISLNVDNSLLYPFGLSALENVYKVYIQKLLLQDCVLLYRMKNAPDRYVFKIPMGGVPRHLRRKEMEKCRNMLYQKKMPSKDTEGMFNIVDVAYNSISMTEDFWLPIDDKNINPSVERLQGGGSLDKIEDLTYWENLLIRGLKVPQAWVSFQQQDVQRNVPNTSSIMVQEQRFYQYCKRLQSIIISEIDKDFKRYLKKSGINVDINSKEFFVSFYQPENITRISDIELESKKIGVFNSIVASPYISKQFAMKKWLGLSEEEFNENQRLLILENQNVFKGQDIPVPSINDKAVPGLKTVGLEDIPEKYLSDITTDIQAGINDLNNQGGGMGDMGLGGLGGMEGDMGGLGMESPSISEEGGIPTP